MQVESSKASRNSLSEIGINKVKQAFFNLEPAELIEASIRNGEGFLSSRGALAADTGQFTGRSPKDRYIVQDADNEDSIWWGDINIPFSQENFDALLDKMTTHLSDKTVYVRDAIAGADPAYGLNIRIVNTLAWHNLFCYNMFLRPERKELENFHPNFTIICIPEFEADPAQDGTRKKNFAILNLSKRMIIIGGTAYAGEMKKGIFSVLNYLLPHNHGVLPMHCSANVGKEGDTAIFFGLSGTGKTTLSTDPRRKLIGDDEHGWTKDSVFNFEGGCYAKVIDLTQEDEPDIWDAVRFGAIVENVRFHKGTREIDYSNREVTVNTRTAYPIHFINNAASPSIGSIPKNIFFLTADAFGVLPPISRLNTSQAMYHFISGYTAKVAGTEVGVKEPEATFSACFGEAFLPLHPTAYASLFGEKMEQQQVRVWLINTGWSGGSFGTGSRIKLRYTRAMITAALEGKLDGEEYQTQEIFGVAIPKTCPDVPSEILNPRNTWKNKLSYDLTARRVAEKFIKNFEKYKDYADESIASGGPVI